MPENEVLFVKLRFTSDLDKVYGIGYFIFAYSDNLSQKIEILQSNILVSRFKFLLVNDFTTAIMEQLSFQEMEKKLRKVKTTKEYNSSLSNQVFREIETFLMNADERKDCYDLFLKKREDDLRYKFQYLFKRKMNINDAKFDFYSEMQSRENISRLSNELSEEEQKVFKQSQSAFDDAISEVEKKYISESYFIKEVSFSISPITGILVQNIRIGDILMGYIPEASSRTFIKNPIQSFQKKQIPVIVEEVIQGPKGQYFFLVRISEKEYGKVLESENVNVKVAPISKEDFFVNILAMDNLFVKNRIVEAKKGIKKDTLLLGVMFLVVLIASILFYLYF